MSHKVFFFGFHVWLICSISCTFYAVKGLWLAWSIKMSLKCIVRELREMKDGFGSLSRRGVEGKHWRNRTRSHIAPDVTTSEPIQQGKWADIPPELLWDIVRRVEENETSWPARKVVVYCASVCKSWRVITKEIVKTPEECGRLTFPISLKQVMVNHCFLIYHAIFCANFPLNFK